MRGDVGWFEYVLQRLTLMLVILGVKAEEVRKCESNLAALWKMVLEHDERDTLLNDGKKWNRKVGAEYFCETKFVPKSAVVFAWNWDAQENAVITPDSVSSPAPSRRAPRRRSSS